MVSNLTAIDLFAGAGGLSLGFENAGFSIPFALEVDDWAADTYENNRAAATNVARTDIREVSDSFFKSFSGIDAVIGGPPCQGFSISASNRRRVDDPRNELYKHFLRAVAMTEPQIVFMENVTAIMSAKTTAGDRILDDICSRLIGLGYTPQFGIVNAVTFGVPQDRKRFFLVAARGAEMPTILEPGDFTVRTERGFFCDHPQRTLWDAISDLERLDFAGSENEPVQFYTEAENEYQKTLRGSAKVVFNHIPMKHSKRLIERFKLIGFGNGNTLVPFEHGARKRSDPSNLSGVVYGQNHRRLNPHKPSTTITASFYSSFIHPFENRNLTVREAARIQSFPDCYRFFGKRTTLSKKLLTRKGIFEDLHLDQFNQVGNAVPPLLSQALAERIIIKAIPRKAKHA